MPRKGENMNSHGDYARIGDLIEIIGAQGTPTGVRRLVLGVVDPAGLPSFRYLYLEGEDYKIRAAYARIVSRASRK